MPRMGVLLGLLLWAPLVGAHALAPALLELRERANASDAIYDVLWRTSVARVQGSAVEPILPPACEKISPVTTSTEDNQSLVLRWQARCPGGVDGQTIGVRGLELSPINVILRIERANGAVISTLLDGERPTLVLDNSDDVVSLPPVFPEYLTLGIEHLLGGLDHLLFVLGLVLLVRKLKLLILTITAFTIGHSLTLALAVLGVVEVNSAVTEFAIALSIVVLAFEVVRPRPLSLVRRRPWLMAVGFGLLHGLGFAGALVEVGLPAGEIPLALFAFNVGIELGQLLVVALMLVLMRAWANLASSRLPATVSTASNLFLPYLIGSLGAFWCIERAVAAWA